jgi:hypothetical protein
MSEYDVWRRDQLKAMASEFFGFKPPDLIVHRFEDIAPRFIVIGLLDHSALPRIEHLVFIGKIQVYRRFRIDPLKCLGGFCSDFYTEGGRAEIHENPIKKSAVLNQLDLDAFAGMPFDFPGFDLPTCLGKNKADSLMVDAHLVGF